MPGRTQPAEWSVQAKSHGPLVEVTTTSAKWPLQPYVHGHPPAVPNGPGCNQWVSTAGPVRSFWVEVVSGAALHGQLYMAR